MPRLFVLDPSMNPPRTYQRMSGGACVFRGGLPSMRRVMSEAPVDTFVAASESPELAPQLVPQPQQLHRPAPRRWRPIRVAGLLRRQHPLYEDRMIPAELVAWRGASCCGARGGWMPCAARTATEGWTSSPRSRSRRRSTASSPISVFRPGRLLGVARGVRPVRRLRAPGRPHAATRTTQSTRRRSSRSSPPLDSDVRRGR